MRRFLHVTATLTGLIIGVGIFGVPYVSARSGLGVGLIWIAILGAVMLALHLFYGEVVARTPGKHRLPGYVGHYLGPQWKKVTLVTDVVRFWGLQVAYLIVGGNFLELLLRPYLGGSAMLYSFALFAIVAVATFFGLRVVERIEFYATWILVGALLVISGKGLPHLEWDNLVFKSGMGLFIPYGVTMVALSGAVAIPELWDIARRNARVFRSGIVVGTLIPVLVTAFFAVSVVGVTGVLTSPEAVTGLQAALGGRLVILGALAGFFAVITSYLVIALYLQEVLRYDFLVKRPPAWLFAVVVPLILFLAGAHNFISVIDVIGSVLMGIEGLFIVALGILVIRRRKLSGFRLLTLLAIGIAALLATGVVLKVNDLL